MSECSEYKSKPSQTDSPVGVDSSIVVVHALLAHVVHVGHLDVVEEALGDCGAAATKKTYRARAQNHISPGDRELCWAAMHTGWYW